MKRKIEKIMFIFGLISLFLSSSVLASSAYTEYEGSGDLGLSTTIDGVSSSVEIHTGCEGVCPCCCCPDEPGYYEGEQYVSSYPKIGGGTATTENGCAEQHTTVIDESDGKVTYSIYDAVMDGSGIASIYYYEGSGFQEANGSGTAYVSFSQYQEIDGEFNYQTQLAGQALDTYAGLLSYYELDPNYQAAQMYLSGPETFALVYLDSTDLLNLALTVDNEFLAWLLNVYAIGNSSFATSSEFPEEQYVTEEVEID